jgi:hypothetical protein
LSLEFLGRLDEQVKIRGYRVELGEIEAALRDHGAVQEAVVIVRGDVSPDSLIVAYLVKRKEAVLNLLDLRNHMQMKLPGYMLPSVYTTLDSFPLTSHGKIDRRALPDPDALRADLGHQYLPPRTAVEQSLCLIWARVLRLDQVGIEDDFFEFGGHSLLATQVISQVRRLFGVDVALRCMFENPRVAGFAEIVEAAHREQTMSTDALLDRIEALPPDEVHRLLSKYESETQH